VIAFRKRRFADAIAFAALVGGVPISRVEAQAATITMPKQAAQRAAAAANAQLQAQVSQVQGGGPAQGPAARASASGQAPASRQGAAAPGQRAGAPTGVVQTGAPTTGARAPDPANAIMREVFEYGVQGRRDPFYSLLATGELRPMLSDLKLTTILYDLSGRRPVAVMNDLSTGLQYRVTNGMMLGRMRVTRIMPRKVIFAIDEFGFSRADSLVLADKPQPRQ
jgi:hypothetical protein